MPKHFKAHVRKKFHPQFNKLYQPLNALAPEAPILKARGNRPLQMDFEDQLKALIFFHLEDHLSGRQLLQFLEEDDFARECVAPKGGIKKSSFFEAINTRGLELFSRRCTPRRGKACPKNTLTWESWSPLTAR